MNCLPGNEPDERPLGDTRTCPNVDTAFGYLNSLNWGIEAREAYEAAEENSQFECNECGRAARLYCGRCVTTPLALPRHFQLGVNILVYRHPKESKLKSSSTPLPLLTPEVVVKEWSPESMIESASGNQPGTWLVFPREDAVDATEVHWDEVSQLIVLDSRWGHAKAMADSPRLRGLPSLRLGGSSATRSQFWRTVTEKMDQEQGLLSTVECIHQVLLCRSEYQSQKRNEEVKFHIDDLLLFFALRLRLVIEDYARNPNRCCPWCTETEKRRCVHSGNERVGAKRLTATA